MGCESFVQGRKINLPTFAFAARMLPGGIFYYEQRQTRFGLVISIEAVW
jgi:hypothetical protein